MEVGRRRWEAGVGSYEVGPRVSYTLNARYKFPTLYVYDGRSISIILYNVHLFTPLKLPNSNLFWPILTCVEMTLAELPDKIKARDY